MKPYLRHLWHLSLNTFAVLLLGLLAGCALNPPGRGSELTRHMTVKEEAALGRSAYLQAIQKNGGIYQDSELGAYVSAVGQRLVLHSQRPELKFRFVVINNSAPNALALPGGYVAITRGLLTALSNESELATVLGHEIGHVTAQHILQGIEREALTGTVVDSLGKSADSADYSQLASPAGGVVAKLIDKRYSLEQESESDRLSIDTMVRAGYDPIGAVQVQEFFYNESEKAANKQWQNGFFRKHPFSTERRSDNRRYIDERYPLVTGEGQDTIEFDRAIRSLTLTRQGYSTYDMARTLEQKGHLAEAINLYHYALLEAPDESLIMSRLGLAYLRSEDLVPARRYLIKAVNRQDDYYQSHLALGYVYQQKQQHVKALEQLEAGFKLLPTPEGGYMLAEARENIGDFEGAVRLYKAVVKIDPKANLGRNAADRLRMLGNK